MRTPQTRLAKMLLLLAVAFAVILSDGFHNKASAALGVCPGNPYNGFSVAIVWCTQAVINDALYGGNTSGLVSGGGYMQDVVALLSPALWAAIILAITLYGVKLITMSVEEVVKESGMLLFRIGIVLFLEQLIAGTSLVGGQNLYNILVAVMSDLMSWVGTAFTIPTGSCTEASSVPAVYKVWADFDCIFYDMFNIDGPGGEAALATGIIAMVLAALFSASIGIIIILVAITIFVMILLTLARALYTVLLSFFVLALLTVIGPVILPAFVFDNSFTKEVFWKWLGMICSTIFTPMFMVGFLSFFILVEYEFIDGTNLPCTSFNGPGPGAVCSFYQILNNNCGGVWKAPMTGDNDNSNPNVCITSGPLFTPDFNINWTPKCGGCHFSLWDPFADLECIPGISQFLCDVAMPFIDKIVSWIDDFLKFMVNLFLKALLSVNKLVGGIIVQFLITLLAFLTATFVLRELMERIPNLAREMTMSVGLGVLQLAQLPLESAIANAVKGAGDAMKGTAMQQGLKQPGGLAGLRNRATGFTSMQNLGTLGKSMGSGVKGALSGIRRGIINKQ